MQSMYTLEPVGIDETARIASFIEQVIAVSVAASEDEKALFVQQTRKHLDKWMEAPEQSLHLKCVDRAALAGVLLVRDFWNLCHLFVSPEHQGRGIGRALIDAAVAQCAGRSPHGYLRLFSARNAVGFYRRVGFRELTDLPTHHGIVRFERKL